MRARSNEEVELFVHDVLRATTAFCEAISGEVYLRDCRPQNSIREDAVVAASAGTATQVQEGYVYVNVYCTDIDVGIDHLVPNKPRLLEISMLNEVVLNALNEADTAYEWTERTAPSNTAESVSNQHFISFNLKYKFLNS